VDDARGHFEILRGAHCVPQAGDGLQQHGQRQGFRLVVDLQGADTGSEVDDAVEVLGFEGLHQGMAAEAQHQVQFRRADLQQQMGVAGESGDQAGVVLAEVEDDGGGERIFRRLRVNAPFPSGRGLG